MSTRGTRGARPTQALTARVQELEAALRAQEDFISVAVHDLKTPVTGLLLQVELLEQDAEEAPRRPVDIRRLRMVATQSRQLAQLVNRVLRAASLGEADCGSSVRVDIGVIARRAWDRMEVGERRLRVDAEPDLGAGLDEVHLDQLFENLLDNAVKYSPAKSEVRVRAYREGRQIRIEVADAGLGIWPEDLERIFGRFERGRHVDPRRFVGTGLGLFICRKIVEGLGGRIWAASAGVGAGSVFHIALPARDPTGPNLPTG